MASGEVGTAQRGRSDELGAPWSLLLLVALLAVLPLVRGPLADAFTAVPALGAWATVFVSLVLQATPFLVLGVALGALVTAFLPAERVTALLPRRPAVAVPVAGLAGAVVPGCECASVPLAGRLVARGVGRAVALTFLLASPAINPVVLVATAVAFPGRPEMVLARFVASFAAATAVGWWWLRAGRDDWLRPPPPAGGTGRWGVVRATMQHDVLHAGGFLVLGAAIAASVTTLAPATVVDAVAERPWLAVLALALLAVVVAICSEADAFVAASLTAFPPTAQLAFMVVGPMVDVKLVALQAGTFGRRFAVRFAPATFAAALAASVVTGWVLL